MKQKKQRRQRPRSRAYVALGSNNFWYDLTIGTLADAKAEARKVFDPDRGFDYGDPESSHQPDTPEELIIFEVKEVARLRGEYYD